MRPLRGYISIMVSRIWDVRSGEENRKDSCHRGGWQALFIEVELRRVKIREILWRGVDHQRGSDSIRPEWVDK